MGEHFSEALSYGSNNCNGERLPKDRLEAVAQLANLYRDDRLIERALARAPRFAQCLLRWAVLGSNQWTPACRYGAGLHSA
jgi:hypothetical protein